MPSANGDAGHKVNGEARLTGGAVKDKKYAPARTRCSIRDLYEFKPGLYGITSWTTRYPDDLEDPPENSENTRMNARSFLSRIIVQSPLLKKFLGRSGTSGFRRPFQTFVHRWEKSLELKKNETNLDTKQHIELLWNAIKEELHGSIAEKMDLLSNGVTTYSAMWIILNRARWSTKVVLASITPSFPGKASTSVDTLVDEVGTKLAARGRLFEAYKGYYFGAYDGTADYERPWSWACHVINSRIIIDTHARNRFNPGQKFSVVDPIGLKAVIKKEVIKGEVDKKPNGFDVFGNGNYYDSDDDDDDDDGTDTDGAKTPVPVKLPTSHLTEEQLLVCTDTLRGYSLKDKNSQMNAKWNAVLLLDEANVFLESRITHDLECNKLVSIFLRLPEYFENVFLLTTNGVDNIDGAFETYIHLSPPIRRVRRSVPPRRLGKLPVEVDERRGFHKQADGKLGGEEVKWTVLTTNKEKFAFRHINITLKLRQTHAEKKIYSIREIRSGVEAAINTTAANPPQYGYHAKVQKLFAVIQMEAEEFATDLIADRHLTPDLVINAESYTSLLFPDITAFLLGHAA
ncbi:hypothetical protein K490DRAFT_59567 [Saccharata proteae CBS 121410]|uniref:ATPase AAA-type core domain-containing protein n=1 Tax=Saccharata proteae CBS 121410 TaxID=1314787 RepID=A0A9P4HPR6_9PEZI|nr:hypothetical protein K490DRAFT_59567 [Saccharata proteae CBS 121410]